MTEIDLADDQLLANECFGGEYPGETNVKGFVQPHRGLTAFHNASKCGFIYTNNICIFSILKRRERFWNAYVLIYERKTTYPVVPDVTSASPAFMRLCSMIFRVIGLTLCHFSILKSVQQENLMFHHRCEMFNLEYFRFVAVW